MTDEEKEAIQVLKEGVGIGDYITIDWVETELAVHTVLNLIEKQDKIIKQIRTNIAKEDEIMNAMINYIIINTNIHKELLDEFKIDEEDEGIIHIENCIKEYFRKKVENERNKV